MSYSELVWWIVKEIVLPTTALLFFVMLMGVYVVFLVKGSCFLRKVWKEKDGAIR